MEKNKDKLAIIIGITLILGVVGVTFVRPIIQKRLAQAPDIEKPLADLEEHYSFISASDLEAQIKNKTEIVLIDSRSSFDFRQEHALNSFNVSNETVDQFLREKKIVGKLVLIGNNSQDLSVRLLAEALESQHYENFAILSGGIESWIDSGGRTVHLGNPNSLSDKAKINTLKPEELKQLIDSNNSQIYVLDSRLEREHANGHIPQAKNIPINSIEEKMSLIPIGKKIIYYGGSELETFQLGVILFDLGFSRAQALEGGFEAWKTKGFPVEK